jgi:hypothetical protein
VNLVTGWKNFGNSDGTDNVRHGGDETVAFSSNCLDESWAFRIVLEHLTDFANG